MKLITVVKRLEPILILTVLLFSSCEERGDRALLYPIPTLQVEEGSEKGFDLSVYQRQAGVQIQVGSYPRVAVRHNPTSDSLFIRPLEGGPALVLLPLRINGRPAEIWVRIKPMLRHTFTYRPENLTDQVVVMGSFNDWSRTALPLNDQDGDGVWERMVYLPPERLEYKLVVNGRELIDPENPSFVSNNLGGWNSILDLSDHREVPPGQYLKATAEGNWLYFRFFSPGDRARPREILVYLDNQRVHNDFYDPLPSGDLRVNLRGLDNGLLRIGGIDERGRVIPENHTLIRGGRPLSPERDPDDWPFAVLYSLMIDRFLDGDLDNTVRSPDPEIHPLANFQGGDLAGIIQKLRSGYFSDLNISTLWLTPLQRQPDQAYREAIPPQRMFTGYHGYWPVEPRQLDPRFGTPEELEELVRLAHQQGIRILLDFVSNHVHEEHPYFKVHRDWFGQVTLPDGSLNIRNWTEETRLTTWFDLFLPSFDYVAAPEAIDQVVEDALWWLKRFDLDGFRQDAVKHVPHSFWRKLTREMKRRFPDRDLYQIGETYGSDELIGSYVNPAELSSQFNFSIYFNARGQFSSDQAEFEALIPIIQNNLEAFTPLHLMGNITSSHDQTRFIALADGQVDISENAQERAFNSPPGQVRQGSSYAKLANFYAFNLALPGVPVLYYGEEVGLMGAGDPDNRRPMRFTPDLSNEEAELLERTGVLNLLRRSHPALALGDFLPLQGSGPVMIFAKLYFDETLLVTFNNGPEPVEEVLEIPFPGRKLVNLIDGSQVPLVDRQATLYLPAYSHAFYRLEGS